MSLKNDLGILIKAVNEWAGRPTKDGAKMLRALASEIEEDHKDTKEGGIISVFYDKKNKREVKSSDLMHTNVIRNLVSCDPEEDVFPSGRRISPDGEPMTKTQYDYYEQKGYMKDSDHPPFDQWKEELSVRYGHPKEERIGEIAYKSDKCPSYANWDMFCMTNDLVFLRFE